MAIIWGARNISSVTPPFAFCNIGFSVALWFLFKELCSAPHHMHRREHGSCAPLWLSRAPQEEARSSQQTQKPPSLWLPSSANAKSQTDFDIFWLKCFCCCDDRFWMESLLLEKNKIILRPSSLNVAGNGGGEGNWATIVRPPSCSASQVLFSFFPSFSGDFFRLLKFPLIFGGIFLFNMSNYIVFSSFNCFDKISHPMFNMFPIYNV